MEFSNFFLRLGRPKTYYPKMTRVTNGDIKAVLFLCQLLYWTKIKDGKNDGWIWKTSDQMEEEIGLSYKEQIRARKILKDLDLIQEYYRRTEHEMNYKVNLEVLNLLWKKEFNKESFEEKKKKEILKKLKKTEPVENEKEKEEDENNKLVELVGLSLNSPEAKRARRLDTMRKFMENQLDIIADSQKWLKFFEFAYSREVKHKEKLEIFVRWMLNNPAYDPAYWGQDKMKTMWTQAFTKEAKRIRNTNPFEMEFPEIKETKPAEMPEWFKKLHYSDDSKIDLKRKQENKE